MTNSSTSPKQRYWPLLHFETPQHWLNDPNGLVRIGNRWRLLIDEKLANFRDPFVWRRPDGHFSMLVANPADWNATSDSGASMIAQYRSRAASSRPTRPNC